MEPISKIKSEMKFNENLGSIVEVMKTIAVMEYRAFEKKMSTFDKFLQALEQFFDVARGIKIQHPFILPRVKPVGVIAITSDTGLLGGLNMQVLRAAIAEYEQSPGKLVVVGKKGREYMRGFDIPYVYFDGIKDEIRHEQALQLRDYAVDQVLKKQIGGVKIVYPHAVSFVVQKVQVADVLPFNRYKSIAKGSRKDATEEMILESSFGRLVEYLIFLWLGQSIYEVLGWSRLAELAARYTHLESSSQKIDEIKDKLRVKYHKVRHQIIDRSLSEIFAARSVISGS